MRAKIKEETNQDFKPFKLEITFQSSEEVEAVKAFVLYTCSLPEMVSEYDGNSRYETLQSDFLQEIHNALKGK